MSASCFEAFLAKLYVDESVREKFLADPRGEAMKAGLTAQEVADVARIDRVGLDLLSKSLEHKRRQRDVRHTLQFVARLGHRLLRKITTNQKKL